jgi:G3E family GTPase
MPDRVPFSVLTGYLGAGKTTVLNRVLSAADRRVAVLVNELGRIAIDSKLILRRGGDVLELAGGCVCCKIDVKNDLWDGIADVVARSRPDHVVLETTGIADPSAIFDGIDGAALIAAGCICVVDADAGAAQLDRREEAVAQVAMADRVMLSKLDIAGAARVAAVHARLAAINSAAERAAFPDSAEGTAALVQWLLDVRTGRPPARRRHHHAHQMVAATYVDDAPLLADPLVACVEDMRDRLVRVKGFVNVAGDDRRGYLELAGNTLALRYGDAWGDDPRVTELVLIGEGLDEAALRRRLWSCRAR